MLKINKKEPTYYEALLIGKLRSENVETLSDAEIEQALKDTIAAESLIPYAKYLRDNNDIVIE